MNPPAISPSFFNLPSIQTRKALLLLDFQNDFVRPNGRLPVHNTQDFLDLIPGLVQSFRRSGDVVWVRTQYEGARPVVDSDSGSERIILAAGPLDSKSTKKNRQRERAGNGDNAEDDTDPEAFLSGPNPACKPQTPGAQFPAPILAAIDSENDLVIDKSEYSALQSPGLVLSLRSRFVTELYLCGSLSNVSVYATALDAARQGFTITLVEDCMGFRSFPRHEEAVRRLADIVGANGISVQELLEDQDWQETHDIARAGSPAQSSDRRQNTKQVAASSRRSQTTTPAGIEGVMDHLAVQTSPLDPIRSETSRAPQNTESQRMSNTFQSTPAAAGVLNSIEIEADDNPNTDSDEEPLILPPSKYFRGSSRALRESQAQEFTRNPPARMHRSRTEADGPPPASRRPNSSVAESNPRRTSNSPVATPTRGSSTVSRSPSATMGPAPARPPAASASAKKKQKATSNAALGPEHRIGEGDSRILYDLDLPSDAFANIRDEVKWQTMYHMSGQVPRLVSVQGEILPDRSIPLYRHPADESPQLEAFTLTVNHVRKCVERIIGQPLNHVLIQLYRNGQDRISEHSDKTLDIVRGSSIVNVSLGAQRTMILRTKSSAVTAGDTDDDHTNDGAITSRQSQRVPMPHGSMFELGPLTNMRWLHGIRADKRPDSDKLAEEQAYNGERISLTFRNIGTFINTDSQTIWGQGAVNKYQSDVVRRIIHADAAETDRLIQAFGRENRETEFDWDAVYGSGFDVVNFVTPAVAQLTLSEDPIADLRVKVCLTENGMRYATVHSNSNGSTVSQPIYNSPDGKVTLAGDIQILLHLARLSPDSTLARPGLELIRGGSFLLDVTELGTAWRQYLLTGRDTALCRHLSHWEARMRDTELQLSQHYVSGVTFGIDDCAFWPILRDMQQRDRPVLTSTDYPHLLRYYHRIEKRGCVRAVLAETGTEKGI
jgi:nicotinamidase-related amidase